MSTMTLVRPISPELLARTISSGSSLVDLQHPAPDLNALYGAHAGSVEKLEQTAERMSGGGSDIGEEIRKMREEQRRAESRRCSLARPHTGEESRSKPGSGCSRKTSTSSYANSIVDVNGAARWGGFSPNGYVTSPLGSVRSVSRSHSSIHRSPSSLTSRFTQLPEPEWEGRPLDSPVSSQLPVLPPIGDSSHSGFIGEFDQISGEVKEEVDVITAISDNEERSQPVPYNLSQDPGLVKMPDRPPSAASTDTFRQADTLFQDFDGVHYAPSITGSTADVDAHSRDMERGTMAQLEGGPQDYPELPSGEDMLYYPAPVPMTLNFPKRLSRMPSLGLQEKRRTQVPSSLSDQARRSQISLAQVSADRHALEDGWTAKRKSVLEARRSKINLASLPPQLRASVFFDHQHSSPQQVEVKDQSAVATLESILNASTNAPASAFTDHPISGLPAHTVYGKISHSRSETAFRVDGINQAAEKSASSVDLVNQQSGVMPSHSPEILGDEKKEPRKSRTSLLFHFTKRFSSDPKKVPNLNDDQHAIELPFLHDSTGEGSHREEEPFENPDVNADLAHEDGLEDRQDGERPLYAKPQTLMAEIDIRKDHQKKRNLTAANAFPTGMHTTLLEQDAVRQVQKQARMNQRIQLAWDNEAAEGDDEDIPLGQLFPQFNRNGLVKRVLHSSGPRGLMEQRQLEDNEPLSRRRDRLLGHGLNKRGEPVVINSLALNPLQHAERNTAGPEPDEEKEETLAQRKKRLQKPSALNSAFGDIGRPNSQAFMDEVMDRFGGLDAKGSREGNVNDNIDAMPRDKEEDPENETLSQRRKRLQAAAVSRPSGDMPSQSRQVNNNTIASNHQLPTQASVRPALEASHSMADILSAHPSGPNEARKTANQVPAKEGGLLNLHEHKKEKHGQEIVNGIRRTSSMCPPMVDNLQPADAWRQSNLMAAMGYNGMADGVAYGYSQGDYFGGTGPYQRQPVQTPIQGPMWMQMHLPMQMPMQTPVSFHPATSHQASLSYGSSYGVRSYNSTGFNGSNIASLEHGYGGFNTPNVLYSNAYSNASTLQLGQQMAPIMDPMINPKRRDLVDRWRQSIL